MKARKATTTAPRSTGRVNPVRKTGTRATSTREPVPETMATKAGNVITPGFVPAAAGGDSWRSPSRHQEIRARAYLIWRQAGCPEGQALAHWLEAESQVLQSGNGNHPAMPVPHPAAPPNGSRRRLLDLIAKA